MKAGKKTEKAEKVVTGATKSPAALTEEKILEFWREHNIFQKSLKKPSPSGNFVFYEGPPTANGMPGIHHLEARSFKDIIPRYKTMRGFHVERKGGWDTHGLPVELQVEKKLGLTSKKEIESYGIEAFNEKCKESVWEYLDVWNTFTTRMGYWLDQENPYITYEKTYMESVWNILKTVSEKKVGGKDLLYKDYKVVPWCPRCGTALSSHELAQGYEDVKDLSVTVELRVKDRKNTSLLAWTTTPWTLPGNVALAVNPEIAYVEIEKKDMGEGELVRFILAKERLEQVFAGSEYSIVKEMKGADLVGLEYEPLYPYLAQKFAEKNVEAFEKAFKVYLADFVTTTDGTGIVHTAVMYGQDDFELGTKIGLPKHHLVKEDGHFIDGMDFLSGKFVRDEETAVDIIKDLAHRSLLFKKEKYAHSYPHCWRCKTPLIYYARDSWYIRMSALRDTLVSENESINWEPEHIKEGRFGEWLREVKDWAISRERYWGTPLPVWESAKGKRIVVGSIGDLKSKLPKRNNVVLMRHSESESNVKGVISSDINAENPLTDRGREQAKDAAKIIAEHKIDFIFTSPFARSKETAEIIAQEIGFKGEIVEDKRLGELQTGDGDGKTWAEFESQFKNMKERFTKRPAAKSSKVAGGVVENWDDARARMTECMQDIDARFEGKNILVISHGGPLNLLAMASLGYSVEEMAEHYEDSPFENAVPREIDWRNLPRNRKFEIDLHRPFIDAVELYDESGEKYTRVKEVLDVWFDSGAMPFAQHHYPFGGNSSNGSGAKNIDYPADYISEAVDQTRGWFYTLLAIGVLMDEGKAYKNVICLGHILDEEGKKMSKSLGNIVDPWIMMDKYGVDALRLWMYTVNRPGDSKNFDEQTVDEVVKKVFNLLLNVMSFYEMFADEGVMARRDSTHILDRWIVSRLDRTISFGTKALDEFRVLEAGRAIRDFIGDFSTWYIRRSRDRFKSEDKSDKLAALQTTKHVLIELVKYMAPFTPFLAEELYQKLGGACESVHLEEWPQADTQSVGDVVILEDMEEVRALVSRGLELRSKAGVKVRQPLASVTVQKSRIEGRGDLVALVEDELNVKGVVFDSNLSTDMELDTNITPALKDEGQCREIIRHIQDLRKKEKLSPQDSVRLFVATDAAGKKLFEKFKKEISAASLLHEIVFDDSATEKITVDDMPFAFRVEKLAQ